MPARDYSNIYLWFDTEFTSLELEEASLLQVALIATDAGLARLSPPETDVNLLIKPEPGVRFSPWVRKHLGTLLRRCRSDEAVPLAEADRRIAAYIDAIVGKPPRSKERRPVLAGNSISADWFLARTCLPSLLERAHYRMLDVSSWKVHWANTPGASPFDKQKTHVVRRYCPVEFNSPQGEHDAHFDVLASMAEFNYYQKHMQIVDQR